MSEKIDIEEIDELENLVGSERWGIKGAGWRCWFNGEEKRATKECCPTMTDFLKIIGYFRFIQGRISNE